MRKKISAILTVALLVMIMLVALVGCENAKVNYFDYDKDNLNLIGQLIAWMRSWIGNYGWTVVVFTVFLKLIMLPLDIWQRYSARKSSLKMQRIQPLLEGIDKRYGANTQRANEEKQKLYKKQGYSMLSTCLPMILSMIIFFVMFGGLRDYSKYSTIETIQQLSAEYYNNLEKTFTSDEDANIVNIYNNVRESSETEFRNNSKNKELESFSKYEELVKINAQWNAVNAVNAADSAKGAQAHEKAIEAVRKMYEEKRESWLWIKSVWQPDTWVTVMPSYDDGGDQNAFSNTIEMINFPGSDGKTEYNRIRDAILTMDGAGYGANGSWNGLMILPILSIGLSFLSMWISQRLERKKRKGEEQEEPSAQSQQQQATNKAMMIVMPLMMAFFGFMYTGAFAIYMVCNYTLSIISTLALRWPIEKMVEKSLAKSEQKENTGKASYMR